MKLQDLRPATLLNKRPQHRCFPVNFLKCLKKTFYVTPPVAASENGFEEFLRISKGGLTWNDLYDLTNLNVKLQNSGNYLHWDVDEEIKQIRVTQIIVLY